MAPQKRSRTSKYTSAEVSAFKTMLMGLRQRLAGDATHLEDEALNKSRDDAPTHSITDFADLGSDNYEQEFAIGLLENHEEALRQVDAALERIEEGTFGLCESCGRKVPKQRLTAIPYARLCVKCQQQEEAEDQ